MGQLYLLGFGLGGLSSASLVPAAVARRSAPVVIAEQLVPMVVAWLGFLILWLAGIHEIGLVILPMYIAQVWVIWRLTEAGLRPGWSHELTRMSLALGAVVGAAGATLVSPQSGARTRSEIKSRLDEIVDAGKQAQRERERELQEYWEQQASVKYQTAKK